MALSVQYFIQLEVSESTAAHSRQKLLSLFLLKENLLRDPLKIKDVNLVQYVC